ncbi:hypothetical protein VCHA43O270_50286 [Vibrio chagasii]|nr:hypothetical protein VCHA43O270_50286 [Vibrio chagasii]
MPNAIEQALMLLKVLIRLHRLATLFTDVKILINQIVYNYPLLTTLSC